MPTIDRGGFSSHYRCPGCNEPVQHRDPKRIVGRFFVHLDCRLECNLCGGEITTPPIGKQHTVSVLNGMAVHSECKESS